MNDLLVELFKFLGHNRLLLLSTALGTELGAYRYLFPALGAESPWAERGSTFGAEFTSARCGPTLGARGDVRFRHTRSPERQGLKPPAHTLC